MEVPQKHAVGNDYTKEYILSGVMVIFPVLVAIWFTRVYAFAQTQQMYT